MANPTLNQILSDARKLVASKQANNVPARIPGTSPESIPGAEHDSKVPAEAYQPNKETRDGTMVPNSGLKNEGGQSKDITNAHAVTADESVKDPTKKPLCSDDANAKTAELANDILSLIASAQKQAGVASMVEGGVNAAKHLGHTIAGHAGTVAGGAKNLAGKAVEHGKSVAEGAKNLAGKAVEHGKSVVEGAKDVGGRAVEHGKSVVEGAKDVGGRAVVYLEHPAVTHGAAGAAGAAAGAVAAHEHDKKASGLNMELTTDVMAKVAAMILSTEEGAEYVEAFLSKQAGAEMALQTLRYLSEQAELAEKAAAFEKGAADAQALIDRQLFEAGYKAAQAQALQLNKLGQAAADASLADAGADPVADEGGEGGEDISIEDVTAALEALVSEGKVQPEEAQAVLAYLTEGEGAASEADMADAGADGASPAEDVTGGDPNKMASAGSLLAVIHALKARK